MTTAAQIAVLVLTCGTAQVVCAAPPAVELIATAQVPGDALDLSGLTGSDDAGVPHAALGAFGSAVDYDPATGTVLAACDRGPRDGDSTFACRVQIFTLALTRNGATLALSGTHLLTSSGGGQFVGSTRAIGPVFRAVVGAERARIPARLDPEGVRFAGADGSFWLAEEYGPSLDLFDSRGRHTRRLQIPAHYLCAHPAGSADGELPPANTAGRQPNRGFESLALAPDGGSAWLMTQSPLLQDHALNSEGTRVGINMRLLNMPFVAGTSAEYLYLLDRPTHGVSEVLAEDATHVLVLERDGKGGLDAGFRAVYRVDTSVATDIRGIAALPAIGVPPGVSPLRKETYVDFLDPRFALAGSTMPEKIEGLCWGPRLPDGRRTLLVTSDNDLVTGTASLLWVFAIGTPSGAAGTTVPTDR
jgi:hypothetical protein